MNPESNLVDKGPRESNEPNEPLEQIDEVSSDESENYSDWEGLRRREMPIFCLKIEIREIRSALNNLADQNQMLLDIIKSGNVPMSHRRM